MLDYNQQPYDTSGDTLGFRNIEWFRDFVFVEMEKHLKFKCLDVGSGNGRLNTLLTTYFDKIDCIDIAVDELNPKFILDNTTFLKTDVKDFKVKKDDKYDICFMLGSFAIIYEYNGDKLYDYVRKCLKRDGLFIAMWSEASSKKLEIYNKNFKLLESMITNDSGSSRICVWRRIK